MAKISKQVRQVTKELDNEAEYADYLLGLLAVMRDLVGQIVVDHSRIIPKQISGIDEDEARVVMNGVDQMYPDTMGAIEEQSFLNHLATDRHVSESPQSQSQSCRSLYPAGFLIRRKRFGIDLSNRFRGS